MGRYLSRLGGSLFLRMMVETPWGKPLFILLLYCPSFSISVRRGAIRFPFRRSISEVMYSSPTAFRRFSRPVTFRTSPPHIFPLRNPYVPIIDWFWSACLVLGFLFLCWVYDLCSSRCLFFNFADFLYDDGSFLICRCFKESAPDGFGGNNKFILCGYGDISMTIA